MMNEDIGIINTWMRMYQYKCKCAETIDRGMKIYIIQCTVYHETCCSHSNRSTSSVFLSLSGCCSCLKVFGFGTCQPVKATPSSWQMETVSSRSCCTVASSRSQWQCRVRGLTGVKGHTIGHPTEQRVTQSDPHFCRSAWRCVCPKLYD